MKELLFKAKRIDNGEWIIGNLVISEDAEEGWGAIIIPTFNSNMFTRGGEKGALGFENWHKVDTNTICQYTGLTDKNDNKIWENDIVKYHFGNDASPIRFGEYQSCFDSTKTGHIGFYVDWDCKKALRKDLGYWVNMIDCNVIGNIFDNPELIGE